MSHVELYIGVSILERSHALEKEYESWTYYETET